ncbi:MAG: SAM-dependent methyltransferase [Sterolibacteriaceae bacterium]|uniref:SAM-dependent methyltransferase n=1 Tax=Candidatus Methylophosphatis roskildensis TaxID=2899263 RepID=A0A9D7E7R8_9PROT|nr:SAM-dependent methyltransferase [Candidatus Methylophosphatis roskildensis]MBK7235804.1 SAM-dependent methyltransferase [Sterolibacteriaceae bacterium]
MSTDFRDASDRHFEDGGLLEAQGRFANADHLYGFSAECSLKAAMLGVGHPKAAKGDWPDGHCDHVNALWVGFQSFAHGLLDAKYAAHVPPTNPFSTWHANQRYWGRHHFTAGSVAPHKAAADGCRRLLRELILDGVF